MDTQARQVLDRLRALAPETDPNADDARWLADFRYQTALLATLGGDPEPVAAIEHRIVGRTPVRIYRPVERDAPMLFHIHGGGAVAGSLDGHDAAFRLLANRTGWTVAAPGYALAPEHPFPAQLEECYAALTALAGEGPIVVSGDSIGGTIATALAMLARDRGGPAIAGQVLLYPNTDLRGDVAWPSRRSEDGNIISAPDLERQIRLYVAAEDDRSDPLASPLLAEDLTRLPRAFVATCGCDPLRDEGEAYADKMAAAGVAVEHVRFKSMIHAFLQMRGMVDATEGLLARVKAWLDELT